MTMSSNNLAYDVLVNDHIVHIRPIAGDDRVIERRFLEGLSAESLYYRVLAGVSSLANKAAKEFCEIDFDKKMAFVAVIKNATGEQQEIGVARYACDQFDHCESTVMVADAWKDHGLDTLLMKALIEFARHSGKELLYSIDDAGNTPMRMLARGLGMTEQRDVDDANIIRFELVM
jgi:acetyltransferase